MLSKDKRSTFGVKVKETGSRKQKSHYSLAKGGEKGKGQEDNMNHHITIRWLCGLEFISISCKLLTLPYRNEEESQSNIHHQKEKSRAEAFRFINLGLI